jgi:hypothetical protein
MFDAGGEVGLRIRMTVIGFHCSHEQSDPPEEART